VAGFSYSKRKSHYDSTVCGSGSSGPVVARRLYGNVSMKEQAMNSRTHHTPPFQRGWRGHHSFVAA
jgi:hypothetical protein